MSFDVSVTINGLCCYVNDNDDMVHVLMPTTMIMDGERTHVARLMYDLGYESGAPQLLRKYVCLDLEGETLELPDVGEPLDGTLPSELVNFSVISGKRIHASMKVPSETGTVARISFNAGRVTDYSLGLCFKIGAYDGPMTTTVTWSMRNIEADTFYGWEGSLKQKLKTLKPINGVIHLSVFHIPPGEFTNDVWPISTYGVGPMHFSEYYKLFGVVDGDVPKYDAETTPIGAILGSDGKPHSEVPKDPHTYGRTPKPLEAAEQVPALTATCMSIQGEF